MSTDRLHAAEDLLREAVYRSRESQGSVSALQTAGAASRCGLGERAAVVLDLSPRGRELFDRLFAAGLDEEALRNARSAMAEWIRRQDALDRERNHFLKDFRGRHGLDRARYDPQTLAAFEAGLERINAREDAERRAAAERLASTGSSSPPGSSASTA